MARIKGGTGVVQNALYPDINYNNQLQEDSFLILLVKPGTLRSLYS